jgi:type VI secretion system secreted protein VgrG
VSKVFTDLGFQDFKTRLQKTYPAREYTVQYRETDFNFVSRLLELCGIFYFFEQENGKHTLVLADSAAEHRPCPGLPQARFRALGPGDYEAEVFSSWSMSHEVRPAKYELSAYNFETPSANLRVSINSVQAPESARKFEVYDYPGEFQKRADGEALVGVRIEEQETQLVTVRGTTTCRTLASGYRIDLTEHPLAALNQSYVITAVSHSVREPSYVPQADKNDARYRNAFTAIPLTVPFRPPRVTPKPIISGVQTAIVVGKKGEELWIDKHGRVKIQFHWDREGNRDENSSCWVRVSQNWAGKKWGALFLPRIGQEVIVDFLEGDPDAPIITGRVYNADQMPPYELPADQTKSALKSSSSKGGGGFNEIRFDDKKGAEQLFLHGQRDLDLVIERESREFVGAERHTIVQQGRFEQVGAEQHLKVTGDLVEEVGAGRFLRVGQGMSVKAGARIVLEAGAEVTIKAGGGFISIGADGVTIEGTRVNINSGGATTPAAVKAAKPPHKAASAPGAGGAGTDGEGSKSFEQAAQERIELYRQAYKENADKMSESDRAEYEQALRDLELATSKNDIAGMAAAKARLDAVLVKNGITPPADPTVAPGVYGAPPGAGPAAAAAAGAAPGSGEDVDPSGISLRTLARIRGAMWTVPGPWPYGPRPGAPNNITALEYIYSYPPDIQQQMIDTYKSHGYTHCCIGPINAQSYHGMYPDQNFEGANFDKFLDVLQMFWNNGLIPIVFMHPDNGTFNQTVAMYDPIIRGNPRAQKLMRVVVPTGWEPTRYGWSSNTWAKYCQWAHELLPNALILIHTVIDVDAPVGVDENGDDNKNPGGNADGWKRVVPHIHGWLVQVAAFAEPNKKGGDSRFPDRTNFENFQMLFSPKDEKSYWSRFHRGYAGWPTNSLWGNEPIKIYAGEYCSYWVFWHGRTYEEGVKWGDAAIAAGADGYLDGGSVDVP